MKFAQATLVAILASCAVVGAAPIDPTTTASETTLVKRVDINEVLDLLSELKSFSNTKRELLSAEEEVEFLAKRDSVIGNLITALANSGIIGDIFNTLTTDPTIAASIGAIVKAALQTAIVQAPQLLSAIWNSGLLQKLFNTIVNDADLRSALLAAGESLISSVISIITGGLGSSSSTTTTAAAPAAPAATTAAAAAPAAPAKRQLTDDEYLTKRDLDSIITTVYDEIKNSGYVQNIVQNALANPEQSISFLTSAFQNGVVIFEDVYDWAKQSGVLNSLVSSLANSNSGILSELASFVGGQLGASSTASSSTGASSSAPVANAALSGAAVAPLATTPTTTGAATVAGTASNSNNSVYAQLAAEYGGASSSKRRRNY